MPGKKVVPLRVAPSGVTPRARMIVYGEHVHVELSKTWTFLVTFMLLAILVVFFDKDAHGQEVQQEELQVDDQIISAGVFCATAPQATAIIGYRFGEDTTLDDAMKRVNAGAKEPNACTMTQLVWLYRNIHSRVTAGSRVFIVHRVLVFGGYVDGVWEYFPPREQFIYTRDNKPPGERT